MRKNKYSKRKRYAQPSNPLHEPLLSFSPQDHWSLKDAFEGTLIVGTNGSGKTSGPGKHIALQFLRFGLGGLVLVSKRDEANLWKTYCASTGRLDDLIIMEPDGPHVFNFIDYIGRTQVGPGSGLAANVADVIYQIAGTAGQGQDNQDAFWQGEQTKILLSPIETLLLSGQELTPKAIYGIVASAPGSEEDLQSEKWRNESACYQALRTIRYKIENGLLSEEEVEDYRVLESYWLYEYARLHEKTRGIVRAMFSNFFTEFNRRPNRALFCDKTTITPEACFQGKIIVVNLPVRVFHKVGVVAQKLMKLMFQRTAEQTVIEGKPRLPAFLFGDEYQTLYYDYDREFQATARSSHVATVYLTQNLPNTYEAAGGAQIGENKSKALIANLNTKFFLAQDDPVTNEYAAGMIGQTVYWRRNKGASIGESTSLSHGSSETYDHRVRPEEFHALRNGGSPHNYEVDAYVMQTGRIFKANGSNVLKVTFSQA